MLSVRKFYILSLHKMIKILLKSQFIKAVLILIVGIVCVGSAKSDERDGKFTTVMTYEIDNNIFKFRPFDYTFSSETQRVDLMIGRRFGGNSVNFTAYGYWKWDNKDRSWIGTRMDLGTTAFNKRLSMTMELRYFYGLNDRSKPHVYAIPMIYAKFDRKGIFRAGFSGYGKKVEGQDPFFYVGLDTIIKLTGHISTLLSYSIDTYGSGDFIWWIIYFNF